MIIVVKCGHPSEREDAMVRAEPLKRKILELRGIGCKTVWLGDLDNPEVLPAATSGIIVAGFSAPLEAIGAEAFLPLIDVLKAADVPVLGICGGHQLLAHVFGGDPPQNCYMRSLRSGEQAITGYQQGMLVEWAPTTVRRVADDPLFAGLPERFVVTQHHAHEIHRIPPGFRLLATSDRCLVQAMGHREQPVWGVQFHPEESDKTHPDGSVILGNFLRMCEKSR